MNPYEPIERNGKDANTLPQDVIKESVKGCTVADDEQEETNNIDFSSLNCCMIPIFGCTNIL